MSTVKLGKRREICSKLTIKTLKRSHGHHYGVFIATLNIFHNFFYHPISIAAFEQVITC